MPASTVAQVGLSMKIYVNSGTYGSPTWAEITNVADAKIDTGTADEAEVSSRAVSWKQYEPGLKDATFEWDMRYKQSDSTGLNALTTAWSSGTLKEFAFADGDIATSGTKYFRCECKIFSVARDEPLSDSVVVHIKARPCYSANAPQIVTVA